MEDLTVNDLILTPVFLAVFYAIAVAIRSSVTNVYTRKYFLPALTLKFIGAIALGLIYKFYYGGGDTFNYYAHARGIYQGFGKSFAVGLQLLFHAPSNPETAPFIANLFWYDAPSEYFVGQVGAVCALLCLNTYMVIALMFACISFSGIWAMFVTFVKIRPHVYTQLAAACFFVPSLFFWGSGLMKDSLCIGALGWLFYGFYRGAIQKQRLLFSTIMAGIGAYVLYTTKIYILLSFLPPALLWVFNENSQRIRSAALRMLARPLLIGVGAALGLFAMTRLTEGNEKYDIDKIGEQSKLTADYLYQTSIKQQGSAYSLGEQDGSIGGMVKLAPQAIVVALFRPFPWEARSPIMMLSSLEALFFLGFTVRIMLRSGVLATLKTIASTPVLSLCFIFSLVFAASVGIISYNFGTLVRYKMPLIPFYVGGLYILQSISLDKRPAAKTARRPVARRLAA